MSGKVVGHYLLIGLIGKGGYSHVYLAEHQTLRRKMAVKLLSPKLLPTAEHAAKLAEEAVALAKIEHPNVVHVYDFGTEQGIPYLAMEYVDGKSLEEIVKTGGPLPVDATIEIATDILEGLQSIHAAGLLHRDIKPSNILAGKDGKIKLADFGLAREIPADSEQKTNVFIGTADYAAPELAVGRPPDVRTDLYALGATLYKLVTGRAPFTGATPAEKLSKQLYEPLVPPTLYNKKISPALENLIVKLLDKERDLRPSSASEAAKLLSSIKRNKPKDRRPIVLVKQRSSSALVIATVIGIMILGGVLYYAYLQNRDNHSHVSEVPHPNPRTSDTDTSSGGDGKLRPPDPLPKPIPIPKPADQAAFEQLELRLATSTPASAMDACEDFLARFPVSPYTERVLLYKAELAETLARARKKELDQPSRVDPGKIPSPPPLAKQTPQPGDAKPKKKRTQGVPGRNLPPSIREGIVWLARHQDIDGGWSVTRFGTQCEGQVKCTGSGGPNSEDFRSGVTALATLAILGSGIGLCDQDSFDGINLGEVVRDGIRFIVRSTGPDGLIGSDGTLGHKGLKPMYGQALAIQAQAEAFRSVSSGPLYSDEEVKSLRWYLESAVNYLIDAENPGSGWRYQARNKENDTSVTSTALLALEAAQRAGIKLPPNVYSGGLAWIDSVTESNGLHRVGYTARGTGKIFIPGQNEQFDDHPTMTAVAWLCRGLVGGQKPQSLRPAAQLVFSDSPKQGVNGRDFYYWYCGTRFAKFAFEQKEWDLWKSALLSALTRYQNDQSGECRRGSWDPDDRWGVEGGRVYATAINVLTLNYLLFPRPFDFVKAQRPAGVDNSDLESKWVFHLKSGGRIKVISYTLKDDKYVMRVGTGTMAISKDDVERISQFDPKDK